MAPPDTGVASTHGGLWWTMTCCHLQSAENIHLSLDHHVPPLEPLSQTSTTPSATSNSSADSKFLISASAPLGLSSQSKGKLCPSLPRGDCTVSNPNPKTKVCLAGPYRTFRLDQLALRPKQRRAPVKKRGNIMSSLFFLPLCKCRCA